VLTSLVVSSRLKLAKALKVSDTMVDRYVAMGMPTVEGGGYDVDECQAWLNAYRSKSGRPTKESSDDEDLRERKLRAECEKLEEEGRKKRLDNDIAEGKVYLADEVDQYLNEIASRVRERVEQFPSEAVLGVPPDQRDMVRGTLETVCRELLLELAGRKFTPGSGDDNGGPSES
jgi:phage terminase Nu1 subunit (DNA packaging protein)